MPAQAFVDTNVTGTLACWRRRWRPASGASSSPAPRARSARALTPPPGAPAAWITEDVAPRPRNIYGATKIAAEDLCELVAPRPRPAVPDPAHVPLLPRADDSDEVRAALSATPTLKVNELLYRRIDLTDVVARPPGRGRPRAARSGSAAMW